MKKLDPAITDYYDQEVVKMIAEKYGYSPMDALRQFVFSKTRLAHTVGALFVFCSRSRHRSAALYSSGLCSSAEDQQLESV